MQNRLVAAISFFLLISCNGSKCLGPVGTFIASPELSINNCPFPPPQLLMELEITPDSKYRKCGWHTIQSTDLGKVGSCYGASTKELNTLPDRYHGFIIVDIECVNNSCKTVWEMEFKEEKEK